MGSLESLDTVPREKRSILICPFTVQLGTSAMPFSGGCGSGTSQLLSHGVLSLITLDLC